MSAPPPVALANDCWLPVPSRSMTVTGTALVTSQPPVGGNPTTGATVAAIAARWGFTGSRFSRHYHATYGEPPSRTLRG